MWRGLAIVASLFAGAAHGDETWARGSDAYVETEARAPKGNDPARPAWPISARLSHPTDRYDHDVLGGIPSWANLGVGALSCGACRHGSEGATVVLPENMVFEDVAPRLWDVTGDGRPEIVVVESHVTRGARLAVWTYSDTGADLTRLARTAFIGQRHRWLAPAGVGDFDGDGQIEIAYVDRPHLLRELVFVRLEGKTLREVARVPDLTNHQIGNSFISGGTRNCGQGDEVILANADWSRVMATRMVQAPVDLGPYSKSAMKQALACR